MEIGIGLDAFRNKIAAAIRYGLKCGVIHVLFRMLQEVSINFKILSFEIFNKKLNFIRLSSFMTFNNISLYENYTKWIFAELHATSDALVRVSYSAI